MPLLVPTSPGFPPLSTSQHGDSLVPADPHPQLEEDLSFPDANEAI